MENKPRIIGNICEFCGIPAEDCRHFGKPFAPEAEAQREIDNATHNVLDYGVPNEKIADIIIPHHNRHDMLERLLGFIDLSIFNVLVIAGGSFGRNCNKGSYMAETNRLIFANDDIVISNEQLIKIANSLDDYQLVGSTQISGSKRKKYWGIGLFRDKGKIKHSIALERQDSIFPSGFLFGIQKEVWAKLGGFSEIYRTGNEDVDFGLRALELGVKMKMLDLEIEHNESQSSCRFKYCDVNEALFYSSWGNKLEEFYNKTR